MTVAVATAVGSAEARNSGDTSPLAAQAAVVLVVIVGEIAEIAQ